MGGTTVDLTLTSSDEEGARPPLQRVQSKSRRGSKLLTDTGSGPATATTGKKRRRRGAGGIPLGTPDGIEEVTPLVTSGAAAANVEGLLPPHPRAVLDRTMHEAIEALLGNAVSGKQREGMAQQEGEGDSRGNAGLAQQPALQGDPDQVKGRQQQRPTLSANISEALKALLGPSLAAPGSIRNRGSGASHGGDLGELDAGKGEVQQPMGGSRAGAADSSLHLVKLGGLRHAMKTEGQRLPLGRLPKDGASRLGPDDDGHLFEDFGWLSQVGSQGAGTSAAGATRAGGPVAMGGTSRQQAFSPISEEPPGHGDAFPLDGSQGDEKVCGDGSGNSGISFKTEAAEVQVTSVDLWGGEGLRILNRLYLPVLAT